MTHHSPNVSSAIWAVTDMIAVLARKLDFSWPASHRSMTLRAPALPIGTQAIERSQKRIAVLVAGCVISGFLVILRALPTAGTLTGMNCMPRGHIFGYNVPSSGVDRIGRDATNVEQKDEGSFVGHAPYSSPFSFDVVNGTIRLTRSIDSPSTSMRSEYGIWLIVLTKVR